MSRTDRGHGSPRAVIHKNILEAAEDSPDASLEAIADEVAGATPDLVDRVLDEYGDPGSDADQSHGEGSDPSPAAAGQTGSDQPEADHPDQTEPTTMNENGEHADDAPPDLSTLSDRQRETLRIVHDNPEWSQVKVGDRLDVSRATVSRRLNDISGDDEPGGDDGDSDSAAVQSDAGEGGGTAAATQDGGTTTVASEETVTELDERLDAIETQIEAIDTDGGTDSSEAPGLPPELAHKVVHACVHSDRITEAEELRLIEALLAR
jgi:hypothetical protein